MEVAGEHEDEYEVRSVIDELERDMQTAARNLQFEKAIVLRDRVKELEKKVKHGKRRQDTESFQGK